MKKNILIGVLLLSVCTSHAMELENQKEEVETHSLLEKYIPGTRTVKKLIFAGTLFCLFGGVKAMNNPFSPPDPFGLPNPNPIKTFEPSSNPFKETSRSIGDTYDESRKLLDKISKNNRKFFGDPHEYKDPIKWNHEEFNPYPNHIDKSTSSWDPSDLPGPKPSLSGQFLPQEHPSDVSLPDPEKQQESRQLPNAEAQEFASGMQNIQKEQQKGFFSWISRMIDYLT